MPSLTEALQQATRTKGPDCGVAILQRTLTDTLAADFTTALTTTHITATSLARAMTGLGHPIGHNAIQRHRRGDCGCNRA